jgi:glycosyl-4,4'-diaponeurosporenoate acyltransferase
MAGPHRSRASIVIRLVLIDSTVWAGWSVVVGLIASRVSEASLARDGWLTRTRAWEQEGRVYERWSIRRWKDRLPEAGAFFGGASKRRLPAGGRSTLAAFVPETRRAERVHWAILAITPLFTLWNPPALAAAMVAYGLVANLPCIAVQRYNRERILRILARLSTPSRARS